MVRVDMGIHHLGQREIELAEERHVALDLFQNRVDDEGFAAGAAGHQVGVAARANVVELAKQHRPTRSSACLPVKPL